MKDNYDNSSNHNSVLAPENITRFNKRFSISIDFDIDLAFWHLVPSININLHSRELEFEWLCFGIYARRS